MRGSRRGPLLLAAVCVLLFVALAVVVSVRQGAPLPGDRAALTWSPGHRPPVAEALARGLTATGTGPWPYLIAVMAGVIAGRGTSERSRAVVGALAVLLAGQAIRAGLMELLARARPPRAGWATPASGYAFPSGHTTTAALAAGLLVWAVSRRAEPALALTACTVALCWATAVGLTRVYLGVHWASDVLGGWLLAAAWLGLCAWAVARWLPEEFTRRTTPVARATDPAPEPTEDDAPQDPGRRGRSRPA
ncbi:phosphatase PAP2 family protein [Streptomyces sp. NBC_01275]|uniref:phosphatase PAP2 family protein n=1 Tax=Streptomyces sp. NBC_01275 TaxID=2903807 RepID=UPI00224E7E66|nr:phosphatase PAP2 family protein [Streptomyces sp. NBC_01275]MCX4759916.1 phosphatase PAP2 family protein [Streptomyces sp. NBC_01275]